MRMIAEATHVVRRPGHAVRHDGQRVAHLPRTSARINASNPCSEYMFLDDSACNLASINLMKFVDAGGRVRRRGLPRGGGHPDHRAGDPRRQRQLPDQGDREEQPRVPAARPRLRQPRRAADVARPALRRRRRAPVRGRDHGADDRRGVRPVGAASRAITAARSRATSKNREPFLRVMRKHRDALKDVNRGARPGRPLPRRRSEAWDEAVELGEEYGYRNAQTTVLAPTGTIGFMMDCDTTGDRAGHRPGEVQEAGRTGA